MIPKFRPVCSLAIALLIGSYTLIQGQHSEFYGMTSEGGQYNNGTVFKLTRGESTLMVIKSFNDSLDGRYPKGDLVLADNGKLYGMTPYGGIYDEGVLFEIDTATNTFTKKLDFKRDTTGSCPFGSLMLAKNGKLYGMTTYGGVNDDGILFEWDPATDEFTRKSDFEYYSSGAGAKSRLIEASNGKFYGVTQNGGNHCYDGRGAYYCYGVLFEWDPGTAQLTKKFDFGSSAGMLPYGALLESPNGKFYGMTSNGGVNSYYGVLYEWDPITAICSIKQDLNFIDEDYTGSLILAGNGKLYGLNAAGGNSSKGALFEWDLAANVYKSRVNFYTPNAKDPPERNLGTYPYGSPIQGSNGKVYGMTKNGGKYGKGVIFEWDPASEVYHKLIDFDGLNNGSSPYGSLLEVRHATEDTIYAEACNNYTTPSGKYTFTTSGTYKDFLTSSKGGDSIITIFLTVIHTSKTIHVETCSSFTSPSGRYTWTTSGEYMDTLRNASGCDSIITVNLSLKNTYSMVNPIVCNDYTSPSGRYTWTRGGVYLDTIPNSAGCDSIIRINLKIIRYSGVMHATACGSYTSPGGKLWTTSGVYQDTTHHATACDSIITVYLTVLNNTTGNIQPIACDSYTSPSEKYTWTSGGSYLDTIPNAAGCDSIITIDLQIDHVDTAVMQDRSVLVSLDINAAHQWIDCNNQNAPIEGETNFTFTARKSGQYAVILSQGTCMDTSSVYDVFVTGITRVTTGQNVTLYPNPNSGFFTIDMGKLYEHAIITIAELDGRLIQQQKVENTERIEFDLAIPAGIYLVTVTTIDEVSVFRIVKNQ